MILSSKLIVDLNITTHSLVNILMMLSDIRIIGNHIFITSSHFSSIHMNLKKEKWFFMLAQVLSISIIVLIISMIILKGIAKIYIQKSLFPKKL